MTQDTTATHPSDFDSKRDTVEVFIRSIAPELLAYFARRVMPNEDAADCLSETLLVLWRRRDRLPSDHGDRRAWSYGVAHRVLAAHRRSGVRHLSLTARLRDELRHHPIAPESDDDVATKALASLSPRDQELVSLVVWEDLTVAQAASVLGIRADAARARYSRARRALRARLEV
jgi:RNA polymerase sigma-70 factor (ECF subfamily)